MIKVLDYSKKYGSFEAVKKTNLHIRRGEIYALLGPNGGGKTTMFKSIVGLSKPTTGKILIDNEDLWEKSEEVKSKLSFLPQRITIPDNLKIREVLKFFSSLKQVSKNRVDEVLSQIDITGNLNQYVGELSGGMIQRLGLVITFLGDVPIYVLDEPTLNLDLNGIKKFRSFICKQKEYGKTILLSTHALLEAESIADRVGVVASGKIVLNQKVSEFRERVENKTSMLLVLTNQDPNLIAVALQNGAVTAEFENGHLRYRADQINQIKVIEAIRKNGGGILNIATEKPNLNRLIGEHYE
ncbi:MAG: ABC transporter ATP-binding protein [candidate division Zixibacteria bacterium]|nr:ABC transporter ATP-binding protein [candidate division Zixibacteria bacterium]